MLIKGPRRAVLGMSGQGADAANLGSPQRAEHGVFEQPSPDAPALPRITDC